MDASCGAPPDEFNPRGQDWGLPPYSPRALRAKAYRPFIDLLRANSLAAAAAIRALTDEQLAQAAPVSLYSDAPLTCQFVLEDHAVRHSYHHLAGIRRAVRR